MEEEDRKKERGGRGGGGGGEKGGGGGSSSGDGIGGAEYRREMRECEGGRKTARVMEKQMREKVNEK